MEYYEEEIKLIENFNENEALVSQLKRMTKEKEEIDITPLVKLYSIFLEDGQSLQDLFDELKVSLEDVEDIIGGI